MPNFTKEAEDLETDVEKWTYLLKNMSRLDQIPVYLNKRIFQRIFQIAEISNLTPEEQTMYEASLKDKWDYENVLATAVKETERKAEERKSYEFVSNLISEFNFSDEQAARAANTSIEFVKKVRLDLAARKQ